MFEQGFGAAVRHGLNTDRAQQTAEAMAAIEAAQLDTAISLADAAGLDTPERTWPIEQRAQVLLDVAQAVAGGEFNELWAELEGARQFDSIPPAEWVGAGADSEVWQNQIETWADAVRERHPDVDATDRELAHVACTDVYGAGLDEMEREVLDIDPGAEVRRLIGGNFATARRLNEQVADLLRHEDTTLADPSEVEE